MKAPGGPGLDAAALRRVVRRFHADLTVNEQLINDLNVFPVPDGDTGTNCVLTVHAALPGLDRGKGDVAAVLSAVARDLQLGARGNSGVILAEYVRGLAEGSPASAEGWHAALAGAAQSAQAAVVIPREGTMLTVAQWAAAVPVDTDFAAYARAVSQAARDCVTATTEMMPELKAAGVVDAGAVVLALLLDAVASEVCGEPMPPLALDHLACDVSAIEYRGPAFEVMYTFDSDAASCDSLREELAVIGDSVTVTGAQSPYRVHVHVDQPAEAVAEGLRHGRVSDIDITPLVARSPRAAGAALEGIGIVVASSAPLVRDLVSAPRVVFLRAMENAAPSTLDFIEAARSTHARNVVILPSDVDSHATAALAVHELADEGVNAHLVGTRSTPESLAAVAVFSPESSIEHLLDVMTSTALAVRSGLVARAQRDAMTAAGLCRIGDLVGLMSDVPAFVSSTATPEDMLITVVDALLDTGGEVVTLIVGVEGDPAVVDRILADHPGIAVNSAPGGQAASLYLVGVE